MNSVSLPRRIGNGFFAFLCVGVSLYALSYLFVKHGFLQLKGPLADWLPWQIAFHMHFLGGGVALGVGWSQFLSNWRNGYLAFHRTLGKIYVASILMVSGPASLFLAVHAHGGFNTMMGFGLMAICWFSFTLMAYLEIRKGKVDSHQKWMIRSYALTLAAVTLRLELPLIQISGVPFDEAYAAISWLCWVPNLFVAEWMIGRKGL